MAAIDPFSPEGAKQIAAIAGQQPAPISASVLNTPKLATLPQPVQTPLPVAPTLPGSVSVTKYQDNPDGTTTNFLSDGSTSRVTYTKNADGSLTPNEVAPTSTSSIPSISDILTQTNGETSLSKAFTDSTLATAKTSADLAAEAGYRSTQEQAFDLAGKKSTVNDLTNRFNGLKAQADQIPLQIQQDFAGRGATAGGVAPIQTGELRNNAIQQIGISAMLNAANGNLSTAQDQVEYAVKAKFDPLKAQLAAQQAQLVAITPLLAREDKTRAEAQSALLQERSRLLTRQEGDQKQIYQTMLSAAQYGADATTLRNIQNAASPELALQAAGPALSAKFFADQKQQEFDNNIKIAQLAIDQRKAANDAAGASVDVGQALAFAQQYAATGNIPTGLPKGTFGVVSQIAKELPKADGTIVSSSTGVVPSNISSTQVEGLGALRDLTKKLDELKSSYQGTGILSNSADRQRYASLNSEIVDLLARARSGAALTADEVANYSGKIPQLLSITNILGANRTSTGLAKIDGLTKSISDKLNTSLAAHNATMVGYSTVSIGGQPYTVGQTVTNAQGQQGRVNADGSITLIQ